MVFMLKRAEVFGASLLATAAVMGHRELLFEQPLLTLPILLISISIVRLSRSCSWETDPERADPLLRLKGGKLVALGLALLVVALFFVDVLLGDRTTISAPWFNLAGEELDEAGGFHYLIDAWAGFLIEGPSIYLTGSAFQAGEIPYWNPFEACGVPFAANGETAVFSVVQAPLHFSPSLFAWDLFVLLRMAFAAWFATLFGRALGLSWRAAGFVGLSWALSGVFTLFANLVHLNSAMFLPLVGLALEALLARPKATRALLFTTALALALNGGNPQPIFAFSLLYAPRVIAVLLSRRGETWRSLGWILGSGFLAIMVNALPLLSMAELLSRSANRTLFEIGRPGQVSDLLAFASPPLPISAPSYGIVHAPQFWFIGSLALALVLAGTLRSLFKDSWAQRGLALGILLFAALLATKLDRLFAELPLVGGLKWSKYVAAAQLIGLILGAGLLDRLVARERFGRICFAVTASALVLMAITQGLSAPEHYGGRSLLVFLGPAALLLLAKPNWAKRGALVVFLALLELGFHLPTHVDRPAEVLKRWPEELRHLQKDLGADSWVPMNYRQAGFKDAAPPMVSGLLGWHDFRSVTPLPSLDYHRFMAPWINSGPWPPYLLLGASREILLAPVFDHVGVQNLLLRAADFQAVVRSQRADLLEDSPVVRFGELQRALRYGDFDSTGLLNLFPYEAACLIAPGTHFKLQLDLAAAAARLGVELRSEEPFQAQLSIGGQKFELKNESNQASVFLDQIDADIDFELYVDSRAPLQLVFTEWWVQRHITKGRFDFDDQSTESMLAAGHHLLVNRYPLPIARPVLKPRLLATADEFWSIHRDFAATGRGWQPRAETFILSAEALAPELLQAQAALQKTESLTLERRGCNEMRLRYDLNTDRLIFIAVNFDPGWQAFQGDKELSIMPADGAFMSLIAAADTNEAIQLRYRPLHFERDRNLSLTGLALYLILGGFALATTLRRRAARL